MTKVNYRLEMEHRLKAIKPQEYRPKLLLHSCCAPCSSACLEELTHWFDITVFYFNPNISPKEEYMCRLDEQRRLIEALPHEGKLTLLPGTYDPERFYAEAKGLEDVPEGGERCRRCFTLRLTETARVARENRFDLFTTTLTISPLKNAEVLNEIGLSLSVPGTEWLCSDFKKKNGYRRSCELSGEYGLYRQDYCGCIYSKMERDRRYAEKEEVTDSKT